MYEVGGAVENSELVEGFIGFGAGFTKRKIRNIF
jgi:hypothetical protein